jgi:hypothetical protein
LLFYEKSFGTAIGGAVCSTKIPKIMKNGKSMRDGLFLKLLFSSGLG